MRAKETRDSSIVDATDGSIKEKGGGISSLLIDGSVGERSCGAAEPQAARRRSLTHPRRNDALCFLIDKSPAGRPALC